MQIQISWQEPSDLDLNCLQGQGISGFSKTRVKKLIYEKLPPVDIFFFFFLSYRFIDLLRLSAILVLILLF